MIYIYLIVSPWLRQLLSSEVHFYLNMVLLSIICASTTYSLIPGDSFYLYVCFLFLARFLGVSVCSVYLLNGTGFLVHILYICSHFVDSQCYFYHLQSSKFQSMTIRSWFVIPSNYIFLDFTITGINIECYIFYPPWICFNAGLVSE